MNLPEGIFAIISSFFNDQDKRGDIFRKLAGNVYYRYVDKNKKTRKNGLLHSFDDKPIFVGNDTGNDTFCSVKCWYKNGELHRDNDLPAIIYHDISYWYIDGKEHREAIDVEGIYGPKGGTLPASIGSYFYTWSKQGMPHRDIERDEKGCILPAMLDLLSPENNKWYFEGKEYTPPHLFNTFLRGYKKDRRNLCYRCEVPNACTYYYAETTQCEDIDTDLTAKCDKCDLSCVIRISSNLTNKYPSARKVFMDFLDWCKTEGKTVYVPIKDWFSCSTCERMFEFHQTPRIKDNECLYDCDICDSFSFEASLEDLEKIWKDKMGYNDDKNFTMIFIRVFKS